MLLDELTAAFLVGEQLDALGVTWLVGGSVASSLLGEIRATSDVDLVADLRGDHITPLFERLSPRFYLDRDAMRWAVRERSSFNAIHEQSLTKVDVFCAKDDALSREQLTRIVIQEAEERRFPVASPEDIVLQKLIWYRLGGHVSDRQWKDALGVVLVQGDALDRSYLHRHAGAAGIDDLLARLLSAIDRR